MQIGKKILLLVSAVLLLSCTGCVQSNTINRRAIVQAIGLDWENGKFSATLEYFSPSGGSEQPIDAASTNSEFAMGTGLTVSSAIQNAALPKGKIPFYAQSSILVVGRSLAERELPKVIDFVNLDADLRVNTEVFIADSKASDLINPEVNLGVLPGETIERIYENYYAKGLMPDVEYFKLVNYYYNPYLSCGIPVLRVVDSPTASSESSGEETGQTGVSALPKMPEYVGLGVVREERLSGELDLVQTRGVLFLMNEVDRTDLDTVLPDGTPLSVNLIDSETIVHPVLENGKVSFAIRINNTANLQEYHPMGYHISEKERKRLVGAIDQLIRQECTQAWEELMQKQAADLIGYGNIFRAAYPERADWMKEHWREILPEITYQLEIHTKIE